MRVAFLIATLSLLTACTSVWQAMSGAPARQGVSSSLVDFLYPGGEEPPANADTVPRLAIPLRVGVAFVPSAGFSSTAGLTESHKATLLERVRGNFTDRDYIREIVVVPDAYLRKGGGFASIDQVARLHGLDVIALVSYDQVAVSDDRTSSLLYWTIVGAYVIKGSKHDVQTFVDTAVFDVATRRLLFRAPGINQVQATSTLIASPERMREARERSFDLAMGDMTGNLGAELERFRERIKQDRSVIVAQREGSAGRRGGGAFDVAMLGLAALLALTWWRRRV